VLLISLRKKGPLPIYRQIAEQIASLIDSEALAENDILPPSRKLARQLSVSRYTVCVAYQELWARGYIDSRPGSYSRVRRVESSRFRKKTAKTQLIDWSKLTTVGLESLCHEETEIALAHKKPEGHLIDFSSYELDPSLFPVQHLRRCMRRVMTAANAALLNPGDARGFEPLRTLIASKMRSHSINVSPEEVLVTNGALQGIDLAFRMLGGPGGKVVVESPTFRSVLSLCQLYGIEPVGVPLREGGMDPESLERALAMDGLRFVFTIPTHQNPTGMTADVASRERLLEACRLRRIPIVEDAFEEEIWYSGKTELPLKSMDEHGIVLTVGTFSKALFPGLRVGWVLADEECVRRLAVLRHASDGAGSVLVQAVMAEFCRAGYYETHLKLVNKVYAARMKTALEALSRYVPREKAVWTSPRGGFLIWLSLAAKKRTEAEVGAALAKKGVWALFGPHFFAERSAQLHLRLAISGLSEDEIAEGIRRLGKALEEL
jgi:DNA-binding transcriptional MocR family regulator